MWQVDKNLISGIRSAIEIRLQVLGHRHRRLMTHPVKFACKKVYKAAIASSSTESLFLLLHSDHLPADRCR